MVSPIKIIDRYIGRQVLFATLMGVAVLSLVLVLGNLFKEVFELLVDKDLPLDSVLKFIAYILPFSLIFTIPWGFLTAVLLIFGRLSADNELVSLRMAGMSMRRICRPVFLLAAILVALSFWINTTVAPKAQAEMKKAMYTMVVDDPLSLFVPDRVLDDFGSNIIYAKAREGETLHGVEIQQLNEFGRPFRYLRADTAEISYNPKTDSLELELHDMLMISKGGESVQDLTELTPGVSAGTFHVAMPLDELREKATKVSDSTIPTKELRRKLRTDETLDAKDKSKIRTEINKRYAFSMACFTFVLVGIPLGVTAQRRETSIGFALSLLIAIVYFLFIILADTFRDDPSKQPDLLMWLPNVIFVALGLFLFRRLSKK